MEGTKVNRGPVQSVLPSRFVPSTPPQIIPLAPVESNMKFPVSMIWAFSPTSSPSNPTPSSSPPTALLLQSLSSVLNDYPILCASLHEDARGDVTLHVDNQNPVAFYESTSSLRLEDCIPSPSRRYSPSSQPFDSGLIPTDITIPVPMEWKGPSVYLQWIRMACGGSFLGLSGFHCVLDAQAVGTFVTEWGRRTRALAAGENEGSPAMRILRAPNFDRLFMIEGMEEALRASPPSCCVYTTPAEAAKLAPPPATPETTPPKIISRVYHFPRAELEAIRLAATPPPSPATPSISVHDALFSHMMQVICAATGTVADELVLVCQAYNARRVLAQPHFFGSAAYWLSERSTFAAVLSSLPSTAALVHNSHAASTRTSLLALNGFLASFARYSDIAFAPRITTHDLHVASWRHSGMYDVDFGSGALSFAGPSIYYYPRYMLFLDAPRGSAGEGGVDVCLALEEGHWKNMAEQGNLHRFAK